MAELAFSKFMVLCERVTGHDEEVLTLIKKRHQRAKPDFIQSDGFLKLLRHTAELITKDVINKYVHIKDLLTELKAYQDQPAKPSQLSKIHAETHTDSSARKRMFDSDTDSIPDQKRHHADVCKDLDENSKDSNTSETTSEVQRQNKNNHEGNNDSNARLVNLVENVEKSSATNGESVIEKRKHDVLSVECVTSKRCKISGAGDVEIMETTVGDGGDGLGNRGSIFPSAGSSTEGALDTGDMCRSKEGTDSSAGKAKGSERQIVKLEGLLKEISKRIRKLEEKDISLDEMEDDSAYTLVERYKAKFVKVWNKLCNIKGRAPTTGRPIERKFHFEGTRYPEVNKRIERFINQHQIFPDFHDIVEIVTRSNMKHCLRLGRKSINVIAREAFIDVGNQLQERRIRDFHGNFGCHLTESYRERNDPALYDKELHAKLDCNKLQWKSSLDEVINKFAKQQEMGVDMSEDEGEEEKAGSDEELLPEGADEEEGKTSGPKDGDREEKVGDKDDKKKDEEESRTKKWEGKKDSEENESEREQVERNEKEEEPREEDGKSSFVDDSCKEDIGKNKCKGSSMPEIEGEDISSFSHRASDTAVYTEVRSVDREVVKETSSSHIATDGSTGSCNKREHLTPDDRDGNNVCDGNTNTREWHNTDDDSNSFNSSDMNIVERDYSNDSRKHDDSNDSEKNNDIQCYNLSSSSSSATPSSSEVDSSSSDEGSNSRHKMKARSPDPSHGRKSVTDFAGVIDKEKLKEVESRNEEKDADIDLDTNDRNVNRRDSQTDVLIMDEHEDLPHSHCIFSPSKFKIKSQPFHLLSFPGLRSDSPIIIDQDDRITLPNEKSPHDLDKALSSKDLDDVSSMAVLATRGRYSDHSCSDGEMNIKIKNYCSLSSDIVVKVTTPDSTTLTDCLPPLEPQIGALNATKPSRQNPWKSMSLPVVSDEVIELSDSE